LELAAIDFLTVNCTKVSDQFIVLAINL